MRIGKQQSFILKYLQDNDGAFEWAILQAVKGVPKLMTYFREAVVDRREKDKFFASVSRSLRMLRKAGLVQKQRSLFHDSESLARSKYSVWRLWFITDKGKELLNVKYRNLTFTQPQLKVKPLEVA
jgi:hypothetical protein